MPPLKKTHAFGNENAVYPAEPEKNPCGTMNRIATSLQY